VGAEVVQDDDVAWLKGGREELFDIGAEAFAVDRPVEQAGRFDAVVAQRGEEGSGRREMMSSGIRDLATWRL
jgi:hypothetical protein